MTKEGPTKGSGQKDKVVGGIKSTVGGLFGNDRMHAEGDAQNNKATPATACYSALLADVLTVSCSLIWSIRLLTSPY